MKVNYKQSYQLLKQQAKALQLQLAPAEKVEKVNEIPSNFNQIGWDITIEKAEIMIEKMKELRELRGKRLTPQFYRSIYNRSLIAINEIEKMKETLLADVEELDYEAECLKLMSEIQSLTAQVAERESQNTTE